MLMHFPVHVGVGVRVNVRVDFGVDFWRKCGSSLTEEELLLCQVLLIVHGAHAVFLRTRGRGRASSLPLSVRQPVGAVQHLRRCCCSCRSAGGRTVFSALTEPQQHRAKDEHDSRRNADDDRPGQGAGG